MNSWSITPSSGRGRQQAALRGTDVVWCPQRLLSAAKTQVPAAQTPRADCSRAWPAEKSGTCEFAGASGTQTWLLVPAAPVGAERPSDELQAAADWGESKCASLGSFQPPPPTIPQSVPAGEPSAAEQERLLGQGGAGTQWRALWMYEGSAVATELSDWIHSSPAGGGNIHRGTAARSPASASRSGAANLWRRRGLLLWLSQASTGSSASGLTLTPHVIWREFKMNFRSEWSWTSF